MSSISGKEREGEKDQEREKQQGKNQKQIQDNDKDKDSDQHQHEGTGKVTDVRAANEGQRSKNEEGLEEGKCLSKLITRKKPKSVFDRLKRKPESKEEYD